MRPDLPAHRLLRTLGALAHASRLAFREVQPGHGVFSRPEGGGFVSSFGERGSFVPAGVDTTGGETGGGTGEASGGVCRGMGSGSGIGSGINSGTASDNRGGSSSSSRGNYNSASNFNGHGPGHGEEDVPWDFIDVQVCVSRELRHRVVLFQFLARKPTAVVSTQRGVGSSSGGGGGSEGGNRSGSGSSGAGDDGTESDGEGGSACEQWVAQLQAHPALKSFVRGVKRCLVATHTSLSCLYGVPLETVCAEPEAEGEGGVKTEAGLEAAAASGRLVCRGNPSKLTLCLAPLSHPRSRSTQSSHDHRFSLVFSPLLCNAAVLSTPTSSTPSHHFSTPPADTPNQPLSHRKVNDKDNVKDKTAPSEGWGLDPLFRAQLGSLCREGMWAALEEAFAVMDGEWRCGRVGWEDGVG